MKHSRVFLMASILGIGLSAGATDTLRAAPQVQLTVEGRSFVDASVGQTLTYSWSTMGIAKVTSFYTADRGDRCPGGITDSDVANRVTKPWVINNIGESKSLQAQVQSCQAGVTYTIFATATMFDNSVETATIRVRVR